MGLFQLLSDKRYDNGHYREQSKTGRGENPPKWCYKVLSLDPFLNIRPSKKINMFLVQVVEKHQKEGIFIFHFLLGNSSKYSY